MVERRAACCTAPMSSPAGTFELPVGTGWGVGRVGGAAPSLPMAVGTSLLAVG